MIARGRGKRGQKKVASRRTKRHVNAKVEGKDKIEKMKSWWMVNRKTTCIIGLVTVVTFVALGFSKYGHKLR